MGNSGVDEPQLGGGYRFEYWGAQDELGDVVSIPIQVTRLNPMADRFRVEAEEMLFAQLSAADLTNRSIVFDSNVNNVNLRTVHDSIYPVPTEADVIAGVTLTVIISGGVIVGSNNTATRAMDVGSWPSGFPITVVVKAGGRIQGHGGDGGDGGPTGPGGAGVAGQSGGPALYSRFPVDLDLSAGGQVYGGGGGGGGGGFGGFIAGSSGGGGAGKEPGAGATFSEPGQPGTTEVGGEGGASLAGPGGPGEGGDGGDPGQNGQAGQAWGTAGGPGGSAGAAIDGVSFVTVTLGAGSILGPQVN